MVEFLVTFSYIFGYIIEFVDNKFMAQKIKVVVTGGAGFIGSHLTDELVKQGFEVHLIDNLSTGKKENINPKAIFHKLDICKLQNIV